MAEVELYGHLAFAKSDHLTIPLAHLADMNDPTLTPLVQVYDSQVGRPFPNQKIIRRHAPQRDQPDYDVPRHTLVPSAIDPRQPPPAATPVWTGSSSTPAWDPSSQTPAHISEDRLPQPESFPRNPYIASPLLPDDLRIEVIIYNTNQPPRWERGRFEGSRAIWPKKNNRDPGIAHVLISGNPYALPERNVKPNHPAGKGPVIVIDAQHPRYCQQMVVVQVRKGGSCVVRPKGNTAYAKTNVNRFDFPPTSLAVVAALDAQSWPFTSITSIVKGLGAMPLECKLDDIAAARTSLSPLQCLRCF
ncbi:hypothetical protein H0H92_010406, partial [Tricholoma furcatifolium]